MSTVSLELTQGYSTVVNADAMDRTFTFELPHGLWWTGRIQDLTWSLPRWSIGTDAQQNTPG